MSTLVNIFCSNLVRTFLFIINGVFLILGLVLIITAAVLKWSYWLPLLEHSSVSSIATAFFLTGFFMIGISIIGIFGAKDKDKCFLIIYQILIVLLLFVHLIILLILVTNKTTFKNNFIRYLNKTANEIKNETNHHCELFKKLSTQFKCCGVVTGPGDFIDWSIAKNCCSDSFDITPSTPGCATASVEFIEKNATSLLIIPSGFILTIELLIIIVISILMSKKGKYICNKQQSNSNNNNMIHLERMH